MVESGSVNRFLGDNGDDNGDSEPLYLWSILPQSKRRLKMNR